eukprot:7342952-Alexandrium_andersonii.AAC.1
MTHDQLERVRGVNRSEAGSHEAHADASAPEATRAQVVTHDAATVHGEAHGPSGDEPDPTLQYVTPAGA